MKDKLKVLLLFNSPYFKPRGYDYKEEFSDPENMYTENDVCQALKVLGHDVSVLGLYNTLVPLLEEIQENKPDVIFNLVEMFDNNTYFEKNIFGIFGVAGKEHLLNLRFCCFPPGF